MPIFSEGFTFEQAAYFLIFSFSIFIFKSIFQSCESLLSDKQMASHPNSLASWIAVAGGEQG
ncbi:MAG: hypothetical protein ACLQSR_05600 [Limisphaerales bacterium]